MPARLRTLPLALLLLIAPAALAQGAGEADAPLTVSVDCPGYVPGCDLDFFQTEVEFARFVRDQADADVYVLVAREGAGGGGARYTLFFEGRRGDVAGLRDTLRTSTEPGAPADAQRRALLSRLRFGLAGFAVRTGLADRISVVYEAPADDAGRGAPVPAHDPWDSWVFRLNGNGFFNGQRSYSSTNVSGSFSAERVTDALKVSVRPSASYSRNTYDLGDEEVVSANARYGVSGLAVWSLGAHWSAGARASARRSTFENYDAVAEGGPAVEYNVYPYGESTRRQLRALYSVGAEGAAYADTTIYGRTAEVNAEHALSVAAVFAQPWGSTDVGASASQYLTRPGFYNAGLFGNVDLRVFRGLSLRLSGSATLVRDQLSLPAFDPSDEEVLTQQRELATSFRYFASVGISYSFGSIYNQVVNPRFGG